MLQNIRQNVQGPVTKVVVWLIVISFSIFGIESILVGGGGGGIAEVNGEEITPQELQQAINTQKRRLLAMMGENIDPALLDDDRLKGQVLDSLVGRKLLLQSAKDMGLTVSKREIGNMIGSMEQFQINGVFSPELFSSVLSGAGYTQLYFKDSLRDDIMLNQLRSGLAGSEFATPLELTVSAQVEAEQRDLLFLTIPLQRFLQDQQADEAAISAYYDQHREDFRTRETVELDYIQLTPEQFRKPVEEKAIQDAYQLEVENGQYKTENRVSHILFQQREGEDEAALQARVGAAQERLARGEDFATVARELSDDVGSAANGGDLGFTTGDTFPPEMEQAIAELDVDTVSQPVVSDAGTHLILVTDRREGKPPALEEIRPRLEEQLQLAQARVDLLLAVEQLKDLAFNAEDLDKPAAELGLTVEHSEPVARDQSEGLFATPSLLSAAFSEEVMEQGHNSDVIELGGDKYVVLRQRKYNPPEVRPLAEVHDEIAAILDEQAARAMVTAEAERIVNQLGAGTGLEQVATAEGYTWQSEPGAQRRNTSLPPEVLNRAFDMPIPAAGATLVDYVLTPGGDAQVISLTGVRLGQFGELDEAGQSALQRELTSESAGLLDAEYQKGLRSDAEISVR